MYECLSICDEIDERSFIPFTFNLFLKISTQLLGQFLFRVSETPMSVITIYDHAAQAHWKVHYMLQHPSDPFLSFQIPHSVSFVHSAIYTFKDLNSIIILVPVFKGSQFCSRNLALTFPLSSCINYSTQFCLRCDNHQHT
jgi:hypothetical protein